MADKSKIEWTDASWTPIQAVRKDNGKRGVACIKVSPACTNCYSERNNLRNLPAHGTALPFTVLAMEKVDIVLNEQMLTRPLHWKRPRKIFVCSQTDLFGEFVPDEFIDRVFATMAMAPQHTFQLLTKRPDRMLAYLSDEARRETVEDAGSGINGACYANTQAGWPLPNVWLGVSAENQEWADKRIPLLLQTPAAMRFVSAEPLLGPVDLSCVPWSEGWQNPNDISDGVDALWLSRAHLDWVITGGESGPGARPSHPDWFRSLRDQCQAARVAFFHKQNGEHSWIGRGYGGSDDIEPRPIRVGKIRAGRLLDGRTWDEFPEAVQCS